MEQGLMRVFTAISGWKHPNDFGHDNDGYVTFENDPKTRRTEAFLWKPDMSHEHLQTMWMGGQTFVRRAVVALALIFPLSAQADLARDEFVREVTVALIARRGAQHNATDSTKVAFAAWQEYQRLVREESE